MSFLSHSLSLSHTHTHTLSDRCWWILRWCPKWDGWRVAFRHSRCAAVCCSVLQCAAVCCSVLQCAAVCCSVLQCVAACCSVLQCAAVCCSMLQHAEVARDIDSAGRWLLCIQHTRYSCIQRTRYSCINVFDVLDTHSLDVHALTRYTHSLMYSTY